MIHKVTIKNFKKFPEFECTLPEGVPLIAGPNNSGKSTLLQAVALWSELWDFFHQNDSLDGNPIEMKLSALKSIPISGFEELWYNRDTTNPISIQIDLGNGNLGFEIRFLMSNLIEIGLTDDTDDNVTLLKKQPLKAFYIPALSALDINEPLYELPVIQTRMAHGKGGEIIRNLINKISEDDEKWASLQNTVNDFFGYELLVPSGVDPINSNFRHNSGSNAHNLINGASGFLQVVYLQSAFLTSNKKAVFLIDEPDAHLHNLLKDKIYRLVHKHCSANDSQAIIASHSSRLIDEVGKEGNLFLVSGNSLTNVQRQSARDLSLIPTQEISNAIIDKRVLYLEGRSDLNILLSWAISLNHPAKNILDRIFWIQTSENKKFTTRHYKALKGIEPNLKGLEIKDKDNKEHKKSNKDPEGMKIYIWERYEIENYLIHPKSLMAFTKKYYGNEKGELVEKQIKNILPGALIRNPFTKETDFHNNNKGKRVLREIFDLSGITLHENRYYQIAELMVESEIHPDVKEILDLIAEHLEHPV